MDILIGLVTCADITRAVAAEHVAGAPIFKREDPTLRVFFSVGVRLRSPDWRKTNDLCPELVNRRSPLRRFQFRKAALSKTGAHHERPYRLRWRRHHSRWTADPACASQNDEKLNLSNEAPSRSRAPTPPSLRQRAALSHTRRPSVGRRILLGPTDAPGPLRLNPIRNVHRQQFGRRRPGGGGSEVRNDFGEGRSLRPEDHRETGAV